MGTAWSDIITNHAMVVIGDDRMRDDLAADAALFFRRMSAWIEMAIPMLSKPPELQIFLTEGLKTPQYDDAEWTSDQKSTTQETVLQTGKPGYELCSCVIARTARNGDVTFFPYTDFTYDAQTGSVTFPQQDNAGTEYRLDFYTDGAFEHELTLRQKRLLGLAVAVTWDNRFNREWLNIQPKLHDKNFNPPNENTTMKESTARFEKNTQLFYSELNAYEQSCAYMQRVNPLRRVFSLL
nr:MAG TPA: hypothetical protein [Caudoviricetes sp.]